MSTGQIPVLIAALLAGLAGCRSTATTPPAVEPPAPPVAEAPPATQPTVVPVDLPEPQTGEWLSLFDGRTLTGWEVLAVNAFSDPGLVRVTNGNLTLGRGSLQTGVRYVGPFPRDDYEVRLEAMRTAGSDFFCGMTFPIGDEPCTLIVGGWGGSVVGLSNVNHMHAAENETTTGQFFEDNRWYRIRLRVIPSRIQVWIDDEQVIGLDRENRHFEVWWEQRPVRPFGIATYDTSAALRNLRVMRLPQ